MSNAAQLGGETPRARWRHARWRPLCLRVAWPFRLQATRPREDGMVQAYILVQTDLGKPAEFAIHIAAITGVTQAEDVTGPYDVIVRAEAANVDDLGRLVVAQIQAGPGATRTLTRPRVHIERRRPRPAPVPPRACAAPRRQRGALCRLCAQNAPH